MSDKSVTETAVPSSDVLAYILRLMRFPYPTICRHKVGADLLSMLEDKGYPVTKEMAKAVVCAHDDDAERLLLEALS